MWRIKPVDAEKYVVCYSGGIQSALVAVEVTRKHGVENVTLLNHDICPRAEHEDIKRFKQEVADYLGLPITYANMPGWDEKDPLDVVLDEGTFITDRGYVLCTTKLKTEPFKKWLSKNYPSEPFQVRDDVVILYGFTGKEAQRIQGRVGAMYEWGYKTDYPLVTYERTIKNIEEIGIKRPITYEIYRHANCTGCLKAGKQHWYVVYCLRPDVFEKAKHVEHMFAYSIVKDVYLKDLECQFENMVKSGITPSESVSHQKFWADVRKVFPDGFDDLPCDCHEGIIDGGSINH